MAEDTVDRNGRQEIDRHDADDIKVNGGLISRLHAFVAAKEDSLYQLLAFAAAIVAVYYVAFTVSSTVNLFRLIIPRLDTPPTPGFIIRTTIATVNHGLPAIPVIFLAYMRGFRSGTPAQYGLFYYIGIVFFGIYAFFKLAKITEAPVALIGDIGSIALYAFPLAYLSALLSAAVYVVLLYVYKRLFDRPFSK